MADLGFVKLIPDRPLEQCNMWYCEKNVRPYCSHSHNLLVLAEEEKERAVVIVDSADETRQQRVAQKVLHIKSENLECGIPRLNSRVVRVNPWDLQEIDLNLHENESKRSWVFFSDDCNPGSIWAQYDSKTVLGNQRRRFRLKDKNFGKFRLQKFIRPNSPGVPALFWMTLEANALGVSTYKQSLTVTNEKKPDKCIEKDKLQCNEQLGDSKQGAVMMSQMEGGCPVDFNTINDLPLQACKEYCEQLGVDACIKLFEQLSVDTEAAAKSSQRKKFLMEAPDARTLINVCDRFGNYCEKRDPNLAGENSLVNLQARYVVERMDGDLCLWEKRLFLMEAPDARTLINVCDRFGFVPDLSLYLYTKKALEAFMKSSSLSVQSLLPVEPFVEECEKRNRNGLFTKFLEHLASEGSQDVHVHNALGKTTVDSDINPCYDSRIVSSYCDPNLAGVANRRGKDVTNKKNSLFNLQDRYVVERMDGDLCLWEKTVEKNRV